VFFQQEKLRLIATALAANLAAITAAIALDANLPDYQAVSGISGQIKSVGSDTLNNEMELWAKGFEALYPGVKIEIEGKGSATNGRQSQSRFTAATPFPEPTSFSGALFYTTASIRNP
jgi:ABC-type phosphate transport system substrate-binding protein